MLFRYTHWHLILLLSNESNRHACTQRRWNQCSHRVPTRRKKDWPCPQVPTRAYLMMLSHLDDLASDQRMSTYEKFGEYIVIRRISNVHVLNKLTGFLVWGGVKPRRRDQDVYVAYTSNWLWMSTLSVRPKLKNNTDSSAYASITSAYAG